MNPLTTLVEARFDPHCHNKYATLMATGNGALGVRATHEEPYTTQTRGMFLAGLYHGAGEGETNELVNLPDLVGMDIELNGDIFSLLSGEILAYRRELHFESGALTREVLWRSPQGQRFAINSARFVSAARLGFLGLRLAITPLDGTATIRVATGIDATQTNSGRQHLAERELRVFENSYLQGRYRTLDNVSDVILGCACRVSPQAQVSFSAKNRRLLQHTQQTVGKGEPFTLEKCAWVCASLDGPDDNAVAPALTALRACVSAGFDALLAESLQARRNWWLHARVEVQGTCSQDQQALDFALYHLHAMTPRHDERSSIAAKGLTGEGYKGHVFWDTEVFLLPFQLHTAPQIARQLLRYRWLNLAGAKRKAARGGWQGALFPWESARSGDEETPAFAAINIRTGERQKVASAEAEHHLVADIAWAVAAYGQATGDEVFMAREGRALLEETARFWLSRAQAVNGRLELLNVIGPDEYTEHINNNAYTSYLAHDNVRLACELRRHLCVPDDDFTAQCEDFLARLYLPAPRADGVIPQDDTFFSKPDIDLTRYREHAGNQSVLLDYSRAEVNDMQILKQADVVMLLYMLPWRFDTGTLAANLDYYEPRTIHDSSLSKAIHGIVAARCGRCDDAYRFWRAGCEIDLGNAPHSSDDGIHAAATGAIWLGAVQGFAGISVKQGLLCVTPSLPPHWQRLAFPFCWQGSTLRFVITQDTVTVVCDRPVTLLINDVVVVAKGETAFVLSDPAVRKEAQ
ncbi:Maltose phosphorylase / Trehalose phosphorylase [Cronobacter condimenti 1330]|uniref:Glycosyl hydrolase family 65 n=1 Tax=Cronobacter condimenti 1330 TaxID=1073999 RepID=K8AG96_9ENTR|nr:glycoside hydrolase family 65 protein [Cronobacter condimenti]ALB62891.1 glycosyl hydrolase family 65 [Cronobacter condimenti 1330]CCJ73267.1 Maltose phosphorylase / Trehalose phosphorylase [Cronobacter condimenti 1330]